MPDEFDAGERSSGSAAAPVEARRGIPTALERLADMVSRLAHECAEEAWTDGGRERLRAIADAADAMLAELRQPPARENGA